VILWFFDATESQAEIGRLGSEAARLAKAFEALSGLIEASPFPMWHRGPDLRLTLVNSAYVKAVEGMSATDVVERGLELVEATGGRTPFAMAAQAREKNEVLTRTVPATIGGARRTMRVVDVPLGDAGVAGYAIDIEETEQVRGAFRRFRDAQRNMLDLLSAGVAQFGPDRALVFCNQPFQRIFAIKPEWLVDRPEFDRILERMREADRVPESRDFPGWKAERRDWFTSTEGAAEESWLLPGGTHLRVVAQPLPDGGLLLIFEDRTEQVQLESARDTLLRVRTATFNNLFEAIGVFAADGRLNLWNKRFREIWDFEEEFLATHPRIDVLAEVAAERLANPRRAGLIRELVRTATAERRQRSGRVSLSDGRHFEFAAVPLPDGNALFTMLDISDSRKAEQALRDRAEALEQADRVKTAFVANMSYELRTPLTSIGGFAEMLNEGYAGELGDQAKDYVSAILDSVARLGVLIDGVLDLTQGEAGGLPLDMAPVNLIAVAQQAADEAREAMTAKGMDFAIEIDPSLGGVKGDARRLRQAVGHLLAHALANTQSGGRILLHGGGDAAIARIVVSDDGPGMTSKEQARAFDPFSRAELTRDGDDALGMGLPLARQFVEAHGGALTLYSEPGSGTMTSIELPR
jgi:signal transduction histidine kinase